MISTIMNARPCALRVLADQLWSLHFLPSIFFCPSFLLLSYWNFGRGVWLYFPTYKLQQSDEVLLCASHHFFFSFLGALSGSLWLCCVTLVSEETSDEWWPRVMHSSITHKSPPPNRVFFFFSTVQTLANVLDGSSKLLLFLPRPSDNSHNSIFIFTASSTDLAVFCHTIEQSQSHSQAIEQLPGGGRDNWTVVLSNQTNDASSSSCAGEFFHV